MRNAQSVVGELLAIRDTLQDTVEKVQEILNKVVPTSAAQPRVVTKAPTRPSLATAIEAMLQVGGEFDGTATELLLQLRAEFPKARFPKVAGGMFGRQLASVEGELRSNGVAVMRYKGPHPKRERLLTLKKALRGPSSAP